MGDCVFCERERLAHVLAETEHFFLLADHAPLVDGHLLIIPREHYTCYGAVPEALEDEFLTLKARVAQFVASAYRAPAFFEHGVYRQTVPHAHLHALPLGALELNVQALAAREGRVARSLADVRAWYAERGNYFYIEHPGSEHTVQAAAIFPPVEARYWYVLAQVRVAAGRYTAFQPQAVRRLLSGDKVRTLADAWHAYDDNAAAGEPFVR